MPTPPGSTTSAAGRSRRTTTAPRPGPASAGCSAGLLTLQPVLRGLALDHMSGDAVHQRGRPRQCLAGDDEFVQATLRDLRRVGATSGYALARGWILARHLAVLELQPADVLLVGDSVDDADAAADTGAACVLYDGGYHDRGALDAVGVPVVGSLVRALPDPLVDSGSPLAPR